MFTIASRQIWPQILAVLYIKPDRVFLLHSRDEIESSKPAQRLKRFLTKTQIIAPGNARLYKIPFDDFNGVEKELDKIQIAEGISFDSLIFNITGGNKLMATAAFCWALKHSVKSFYLEKGNKIIWFDSINNEVKTEADSLDTHLADELNPIEVLRCQIETSEVENEGETLTLSDAGKNESDGRFLNMINNGNYDESWIKKDGKIIEEKKEGDRLEYRTAVVILRLGVKQIQRGLRLKPKTDEFVSSKMPHTEIDLVFVWNGRLWVVDCKDTIREEDICKNFYEMVRPLKDKAKALWERIQDIVEKSHFGILKNDIVTAREVGGLYGSVICVRKSQLNEEIKQYAKRNGIYLVSAKNLWNELTAILKPEAIPGC